MLRKLAPAGAILAVLACALLVSSTLGAQDKVSTPAAAGPAWQVVASETETGHAAGRFIIYNIYTGESYITDNGNKRWEMLDYPNGGTPELPLSARPRTK